MEGSVLRRIRWGNLALAALAVALVAVLVTRPSLGPAGVPDDPPSPALGAPEALERTVEVPRAHAGDAPGSSGDPTRVPEPPADPAGPARRREPRTAPPPAGGRGPRSARGGEPRRPVGPRSPRHGGERSRGRGARRSRRDRSSPPRRPARRAAPTHGAAGSPRAPAGAPAAAPPSEFGFER